MKIGDYNTLKLARETEIGAYLSDETGLEVLLPKRYMSDDMKIGDEVKVFIYKDSEDRVIATTEEPMATVNSFAFLEVNDEHTVGLFLDWGLPKDLLVPKKEMTTTPKIGDKALVFVYLDRLTQRLVASMRLEKYISDRPENLSFGEEVDVIIWKRHDLGYQAIIDEEYLGMIYDNQRFKPLRPGERLKAFVNQVRTDGRVDLLLQAPGYDAVNDGEAVIMQALKGHEGYLPYHDKSPAEDVQKALNMSKKVFKKALGGLYKSGKIIIEADGVRLKPSDQRSKR